MKIDSIDSILRRSALASAVAAVVTLSACGDSGSGSVSSGDSTMRGSITGFGSVFINGVEFETDGVSLVFDGRVVAETDLGVGDVCTIQGSINPDATSGTAHSVSCRDELEGYVLDVSALSSGRINVMGQTVLITSETVFESDRLTDLSGLSVNDIVEVSGFSDGLGLISATRIETKDMGAEIEVKGLVSSLNPATQSFRLGELTVNYSQASEVPANLVNGLYVEAKTNQVLSGDLATGFVMIASKIEVEDDGDIEIEGESGEDIKVQGMVSDITNTSFRFNGMLVEFASLEIDDDFDIKAMTEGMLITVEGYFNASGQFVVKEIEDEHESEFEVSGTVVSTTDTTISIVVGNQVMTFEVNNSTRMLDEQDSTQLHYFGLTNVSSGEYVEIKYYIDANTGAVVATELERDDSPY